MVPPCIPMLYAAAARRAVHETKEKGICNPFSQTTLYSVFISAVLGYAIVYPPGYVAADGRFINL